VVLDSLTNGKIADQNGAVVNLNNGQLTYDAGGTAVEAVSYNTMSTPRGRQFQLVLPDGTHVWLNAASSIRYPTAFSGHERSVEVTGEAFFEVASQTDPASGSQPGKGKKPFYVISRNQRIEVTGTQFNVNAYHDEAIVTTTLFDGKVLVTPSFNENSTSSSVALIPGEQLQVRNDLTHEKFKLDAAQLSQASAWKNGLFNFENTNLDAVLRQLSRWYDVEVSYEGKVPERQFGGEVERSLSFKQILNILEAIGVKYRLEENKKLIIL
jgi:ferric-dicitrate binding protein FerR (iron transport regulator)